MTFIPQPLREDGGQKKVWITEPDIVELLQEILIEMKKLNLHMSIMTDEKISEGDIT